MGRQVTYTVEWFKSKTPDVELPKEDHLMASEQAGKYVSK